MFDSLRSIGISKRRVALQPYRPPGIRKTRMSVWMCQILIDSRRARSRGLRRTEFPRYLAHRRLNVVFVGLFSPGLLRWRYRRAWKRVLRKWNTRRCRSVEHPERVPRHPTGVRDLLAAQRLYRWFSGWRTRTSGPRTRCEEQPRYASSNPSQRQPVSRIVGLFIQLVTIGYSASYMRGDGRAVVPASNTQALSPND